MTFVSSNLLLILLLLIESVSLSGSVLLRYIAPIQDHIRQSCILFNCSNFASIWFLFFSRSAPFPSTPPEPPELRCCYQKYISYLLVIRYILLQEKCSVLFVMMMTVIFIQLMCYYLTLFLSSFNIIFLIIFEPRFICWLEFLVKYLQH